MSSGAPSTPTVEGMPLAYVRAHTREERVAHAQIIGRRGNAAVHVELCPGPAEPGPVEPQWLCVVTDDRPGLLSLLSAGISAAALDIQNARIYCRTRPGLPDEAVDLFAVRGPGAHSALTDETVRVVRHTIDGLLAGSLDALSLERKNAAPRSSRPPPFSVHFEGTTDVLVVNAPDRPGLLLAISLAIFRERLTIVRSHVTTVAAEARDEFELAEIDGRRLSSTMRATVVEKVSAALAEEPRRLGTQEGPRALGAR